MSKGMRLTFTALIPKKDGTREISDYRLISLMCNLYKIISKVLSIRVRRVMGEVVSSTQSTFIRGRQIMDGILIANECVDYRRKFGEQGVVCKLDFEKA